MEQNNLTLGIPSFTYADLYDANRLKDLLDVFDASIKKHDAELFNKFADYRQNQGEGLAPEEVSELLVNMGPYVGQFVAKLFNVLININRRQLKSRTKLIRFLPTKMKW